MEHVIKNLVLPVTANKIVIGQIFDWIMSILLIIKIVIKFKSMYPPLNEGLAQASPIIALELSVLNNPQDQQPNYKLCSYVKK